ncbi:unnamed protein product [Blepharisma stoltei]|uniref:Uncharacterized protein n=1 Tax=Blepharisma stoltei TaxID=1481888 RepID=A0AAU9KK54_9CILI|nr:unnamed protein product [Blepharisma stoltei]
MSVKDRIAALNKGLKPKEEIKSAPAPINIYEETKNSPQKDEQPNQPMSIKDRIALMNKREETSKTDTYTPGKLAPKTNNPPSQPQVQPQAKLEVQNESKNIKSLQEKLGNIQFQPQNPNLFPQPVSKPVEANLHSEAIEIAMQKPLRHRNPPKSANFDF